MRIDVILAGAALLLAGVSLAQAAMPHAHRHEAVPPRQAWTAYPLLEESSAEMRNRAVFTLRNMAAANATVYPATGQGKFPERFAVRGADAPYDVPLQGGRFAVTPGGRGNYFWLMARSETAVQVTVANTVRYFSNPGPAPTAMLAAAKSELELVPDPLPREHWHYREGETWNFQLRYHGQALPGTPVWLFTEHGSRLRAVSDAHGVVRLRFPEDMPKGAAGRGSGHHPRQGGKFVLVAEHRDANRRYLTTFNYTYAPSPMRGKSLMAGAGFMLLGGLLAAPLLRRRDDKKGKQHA